MLGTAQVYWWKRLLFFIGLFCIDRQDQMGRVWSAHSEQGLSFLLVALNSAVELALFRSALESNEIMDTVGKWFRERATLHDPTQALPLMFQSFQDDLLQVAVGKQTESIVDEVETHKLQNQLGIELRQKAEACRRFSCSFKFIGAHYDTSYPSKLQRQKADHILQALTEGHRWFKDKKGSSQNVSI